MNTDLTVIAGVIGSLGFPIVVAWYLLTQMKKSIDANTQAFNGISILLAKICEKLDIPDKP